MELSRYRWQGSLLAGALPFLLAGFLVSALANRLLFVAWGLAMALVHAFLLRHGWRAGWRRRTLFGAVCLAFAVGGVSLGALLAALAAEPFELGLRAFAPGFFAPGLISALAAPSTYYLLGGAWLVAAAFAFVARLPAKPPLA